MRRVVWLSLLGTALVGCAKKEPPPNAAPEPGEDSRAPIVINADDLKPSQVVELEYAKIWQGDEKPVDPAALVKLITAERYFAKHPAEFLAPATVGTLATLTSGGFHGVTAPQVMAVAYPEVAKTIEATWKERVAAASAVGIPALDSSGSGIGKLATRRLVLRVRDGSDDDLRTRFGEYLIRLQEAVQASGATITAHQRGALRATGALSDIRYASGNRTGFVRSVVVRGYDESDPEFKHQILEQAKGDIAGAEIFKAVMTGEKGPYLVVVVNEQRQ
jgi:hypothetical protein